MSGDEFSGLEDEFNDTLLTFSEEGGIVDNTINQSSDSVFRGSSASSLFIPNVKVSRPSSTPKKRRLLGGKPPQPSTTVSYTTYKCHICRVILKTEKGLARHVKNHKLEAKAQRKPSSLQLVESCTSDGCDIARLMVDAPVSEELSGTNFSSFASKISESAVPEPNDSFKHFVRVCVKSLAESLPSSNSVLPSAIRKEVRSSLHSSLAHTDIWSARLEALLAVADCPSNVAEQYLGEFCRRLVNSTVAFIIRQMREAVDDNHVISTQKFSKDDFDSLFSQQTLHNVAGYSVKADLVRCRQYPKSPRWRDIQRVVFDRFAHVGTMEARLGDKTFWTALLGRKAYTFISEAALEFFIEVGKVLCYTETSEGSLSKETVMQNVFSSPSIIVKWGNLIGSTLKESDSMLFMRILVRSLCGSFGRGILLRRINKEAGEHRGRVSAVGLRGRLTR